MFIIYLKIHSLLQNWEMSKNQGPWITRINYFKTIIYLSEMATSVVNSQYRHNSAAYISAVESLTPQRFHETEKEKRPVVKRSFFREFADQLELEHKRPRVRDATTIWKRKEELSSCWTVRVRCWRRRSRSSRRTKISRASPFQVRRHISVATGLGCLTESLCISLYLLFGVCF